MTDGICLTTLLKIADKDLLAAKLEYTDTVSQFTLSDEENHVLYSLHLGTMTLDDADAALPDSSHVAAVYRARNRFEWISSQVKQFKDNPPHVEYRNADFAIPRRFYDDADKLLYPTRVDSAPSKEKNLRKVVNYDILFRGIGIAITCFLGVAGSYLVSDRLGSFKSLAFIVFICIVFSTLLIPKPKDK